MDPILIAAALLPRLYEEARAIVPKGEPMVISFGKLIANGATNIVPDVVTIDGTLRTFNEDLRERLHQLLPRVAAEVSRGMNGECEFRLVKGSPVVKNDPELTARLRAVAFRLASSSSRSRREFSSLARCAASSAGDSVRSISARQFSQPKPSRQFSKPPAGMPSSFSR